MKKIISLKYKVGGSNHIVDFGVPLNEEELKQMYGLRYKVYEKKGYIDTKKYTEKIETDEYDSSEHAHLYIVASHDGEYVGTLRSIKKTPLPTEEDFEFDPPEAIKKIPKDKLREIGRLISTSHPKTNHLPRGLIMLFMLHTAANIFKQENIEGGYAFIKKSLMDKMVRRKMPFHVIKKYKERYPENGVLYQYFHQPDDPVVPMYFLTDEFLSYTKKKTHNHFLFNWQSDTVVELKDTLLTKIISRL